MASRIKYSIETIESQKYVNTDTPKLDISDELLNILKQKNIIKSVDVGNSVRELLCGIFNTLSLKHINKYIDTIYNEINTIELFNFFTFLFHDFAIKNTSYSNLYAKLCSGVLNKYIQYKDEIIIPWDTFIDILIKYIYSMFNLSNLKRLDKQSKIILGDIDIDKLDIETSYKERFDGNYKLLLALYTEELVPQNKLFKLFDICISANTSTSIWIAIDIMKNIIHFLHPKLTDKKNKKRIKLHNDLYSIFKELNTAVSDKNSKTKFYFMDLTELLNKGK